MPRYTVEVTFNRAGETLTHQIRNVAGKEAIDLMIGWQARTGPGLTFIERPDVDTWFYPWPEIRAIKFEEQR